MPRPISEFDSIGAIASHLRALLGEKSFVLLYAYNGTGKTRLSMAFKDLGKRGGRGDTLYYNAYTEDLFTWDNDLSGDAERFLCINSSSRFFAGLEELEMENRVRPFLQRYADFDFFIDYATWKVNFVRELRVGERTETVERIKVSRGEENLFIWCFFLAILDLAMDEEGAYSWVKYVYIDDPISSLDDNNAIMVASDLARLLLKPDSRLKTVLSTHHSLFFNVMCNEFKRKNSNSFFLCADPISAKYRLQDTGDSPFLNHVAMVSELKAAAESGKIYTYHFNMLRNVLERTSSFFGFHDFSRCIIGIEDEALFSRALNLLSHGKYSVFEPREMVQDSKELFVRILNGFLGRYAFNLPDIFASTSEEVAAS
jgi:hypothetical protein